jgi:excisionase family DNA binding protein
MARKALPASPPAHERHRGSPQGPLLRRFYNTREVAASLNVSTRTVSRWIARGDLIAHQLGHSVRIADYDLRLFLAQHRGV